MHFLFFFTKFHSLTNSRVLILNTTIVFFKILTQNDINEGYLVLYLGIFVFYKMFQLDKFKAADFTYDNSFFKIVTQKDLNMAFLVLYLGNFIFLQNFAVRQYCFKIPARKYPSKAFLVPNLCIFFSFTKFRSVTNSRMLISNTTIVFFKF